MKNWLFVIMVFLSVNLFGQDKKEIEEFINQIAPQIVPEEFEYYNLLDTSSIIFGFDRMIDRVGEEFKNTTMYSMSVEELDEWLENRYTQSLKENPYTQMLKDYRDFISQKNTFKNDSLRVNWNDYGLQNTHIYSENNLPNKVLAASKKSTSTTSFSSYKKAEKVKNSLQPNELLVPMKHWWLVKPFVNRKHLFKVGGEKWQEYRQLLKEEDRIYYEISMPVFSENKQFAIISFGTRIYIFKRNENKWEKYYSLPILFGYIHKIVKY